MKHITQVSGYPTIKFFSDGKDEAYSGGRTEASFLKYLEKKDPDYVQEPYVNNIPDAWKVNT